ncbi:nicotinate-nucleotide--dimethylbenzimidazole phosphoribosyltransferase [Candidatus Alkanophaga liquidiphilum]|nr:NaMN:DMB phosphoribosyltransferase [Candidatus Alkanophaga liquidiphilum]RLG36441.1 MAG: nicotinate-nucleotide--dimethylbenzimidazole phosphoribosyltransferase [Candidatus Alkanophagales archaeon]
MRIEEVIKKIAPLDDDAMKEAQRRQDSLIKPLGALGQLEELSIMVAGITGNPRPAIEKKMIVTMAGDHGVIEEDVSAYPREVTPQMVYGFLSGRAAINVLARHVGAEVVVVDMGVAHDFEATAFEQGLINKKVGYGTNNIAKGAAMGYNDAVRSIEAGIEVFEEFCSDADIVGVGDMGIGNTTPSSAIAAFITGRPVEEVTGRGTGVDDSGLQRKINAIKRALEVNKPRRDDAIDVLAKLGGFEIGGMVGVILAAAAKRTPVVIDGFISGAAALIAYELMPQVKNYLIASHRSVEKGHDAIYEYIGLKPLFDLRMRLGEGTGAALAISIVEAACKILNEMATFEEAGVSKKKE